MTKTLGSLILLSLVSASMALAQDGAPAGAGMWKGDHPCFKIKQACEAAGFEKRMHKKDGKGLWKDCFTPIMGGQPVAGVTVDPTTVQGCQAKKAAHAAKTAAKPST